MLVCLLMAKQVSAARYSLCSIRIRTDSMIKNDFRLAGSGKTFTMMGAPETQGLIPRICKEMFIRMKVGQKSGTVYKTNVSYLEIYNERVKDLLGSSSSTGHALRVREHPAQGPYVENLSQHPVTNFEEIQACSRLAPKPSFLLSITEFCFIFLLPQ